MALLVRVYPCLLPDEHRDSGNQYGVLPLVDRPIRKRNVAFLNDL